MGSMQNIEMPTIMIAVTNYVDKNIKNNIGSLMKFFRA